MSAKRGALLLIVFSLMFLGCGTKKEVVKAPPQVSEQQESENLFFRYLNPLTYLDMGNQFMIEATGFWPYVMGTVEYTGEKAEETHRYLEDVFSSL